MTEASGGSESIQLDEVSRAWFAGVSAGAKTADEMVTIAGVDFAQRLAFFWLRIGVALKTQFPQASEAVQAQFISGAAVRQPEQRRAVEIVVDDLDSEVFGGFGTRDERFDEEAAVREIVALLRRAESQIAQGYLDGDLTVSNGDTVGHFKVQLY
jgi:hypothetical protein